MIMLASCLMWYSSCNKIRQLTAIDFSYTLPRTTFIYPQGGLKNTEVLLYTGSIYINLDSLLAANGLSGGMVGNTFIRKFSVTIEHPPGANFDWVQSARVVVSGNHNLDPSQEVAFIVNPSPGDTILNMEMTKANIRNYFDKSTIYYGLYGVLDGAFPFEWVQMYLDAQIQFRLEPL